MVSSVLSLCAFEGVSMASSHELDVKQSHCFPQKYHRWNCDLLFCYSSHWEKDFTKQNNAHLNWMMFVNNIIGNLVANPLWFSNYRKSYHLNIVGWGIFAWERHWTMVGWNALQEFVEVRSTGRIWWRTSLLTLIRGCQVSGIWQNT